MVLKQRFLCATLWAVPGIVVALIAMGPASISAQGEPPCLMCHADVSLFAGTENPSRFVVSQESYSESVHGRLGLSCEMCHQSVSFPHPEDMPRVQCGTCHGSIAETFSGSLHGYALSRGHQSAPTCPSCHGMHDIRRSSEQESPTHRANIANTCAECHGEEGVRTVDLVRVPRTADAYAHSVHGERAAQGLNAAATCTDCHGVHDLGSPTDPTSSINHINVARTCGVCHEDVLAEYERSIHGRALAAGMHESPTCNDCHGEHLILSSDDPDARTFSAHQAEITCAACHGDPDMVAKYGFQVEVIGSYLDSYHGWATRGGYVLAASCSDCHTSHMILPASDTASSIHSANLVGTCGTCHEGAGAEFALSYTHAATSYTTNPLNQLIRKTYLGLIAVLVGGMLLHNLVIMRHYLLRRRREARAAGAVLRLDRIQRAQHLVTIVSFLLLVVTGFALRFPEAWWVRQMSGLGMTEPVRSTLHRICGVLLVLVGISHILYVAIVKRGRAEFRAMIPGRQDIREFVASMRYYLRASPNRARFGRYNYAQKAEYWALIWGTVVMALTGFVLWFPTVAVKMLPPISVTISQTIHYYEAWLATLAIAVWHFFFVFFYPGEYPMSWTWLSGKMPKRVARRHHARWYEEEIARDGAESEVVAPSAGRSDSDTSGGVTG